MKKEQIILGIDPGTNIMGFGIIAIEGKTASYVDMGVINLSKLDDHPLKLKKIFDDVIYLIDKHHPDFLAIEAPFFGKNVQSMLKLGRAQGVAIAAALSREIPIHEYSPRKIKQSVTGRGAASKEQVASMLEKLLNLKEMPKYFDSTDALAVAMCHFLQNNTAALAKGEKYTGWDSFAKNNAHRIK